MLKVFDTMLLLSARLVPFIIDVQIFLKFNLGNKNSFCEIYWHFLMLLCGEPYSLFEFIVS